MPHVLTAEQRHEAPPVPALLERGAVTRPSRGRPRIRPRRVVGDKGDPGAPTRSYRRRRGIRAVLPTPARDRRRPRFDRAAYRQRNRVERLINRRKQHRAIAAISVTFGPWLRGTWPITRWPRGARP